MKNLFFVLFAVAFLLPSISLSQDKDISDSAKAVVEQQIKLINEKIKEKNYNWTAGVTSLSYLSEEEMKALCGLNIDESELPKLLQKGDSLYQDFKFQKEGGLLETRPVVPNWIWAMSYIENQECGNCWAHAATGVTDGLLHNYYGSNIQIDLNEMDVTNNSTCGDCGGTYYLDCGLSYIYSSKVCCEQGINQFPNYDHAYYTVSSYSNNTASISAIKASLESSPVLAAMAVYYDFYFYDGGIYRRVSEDFLGYHAIVIVGYNDDEEYWVCKNSWGIDWGERQDSQTDPYPAQGYFRIAYGECGIDAIGNVTASVARDSCFAKIIPNFQTFQNAMAYRFVNNEWTYVLNDVSVGSGVTVNVPSNATVYFFNGKKLGVYGGGTLISNGATFQGNGSPGYWHSIYFYANSSGNIQNSTIKDAQCGIYANQSSNLTISNSTI